MLDNSHASFYDKNENEGDKENHNKNDFDKTPLGVSNFASKILDDNKAEDIVLIDLTGKSDIADFLIIASGRSNRHVKSLAGRISEALKKGGLQISTEGMDRGDWVLVDAGNVIMHLFQPSVREYYRLEEMWSDAEKTHKKEAG